MESFIGTVIAVKELRQVSSATESTLQIDIKLSQGNTYKTGENLKIYPENSKESVRKALECTGLAFDIVLVFETAGKLPFPSHIQASQLFKKFPDLQGPLKKSTIKNLIEMVRDPNTIKE